MYLRRCPVCQRQFLPQGPESLCSKRCRRRWVRSIVWKAALLSAFLLAVSRLVS